MRDVCFIAAVGFLGAIFASFCEAQEIQLNPQEIQLNPGERLLSVGGVPVCANGRCPITPVRTIAKSVISVGKAIGHGTIAYAHALREAQMMARQNRHGHLLGTAPGCTFSGVGVSHSIDVPAHCTSGNRVLVARAYCVGSNGRVYWSAHYR